MSGSAATSDLVKLALVVLQTGAARSAQQSIKLLVRVALLQTVAALCVIAALGCAGGALLIYLAPIIGGAGALLAGAGVFGVLALAAFGLAWRAGKMRSRSPVLGSGGDAALAAAANLFKQHTGLALVAALLAGVFLGGER
ncbi:MAG: hypothetical protein ABSF67_19865 [Roseiarcus sp.]